MSINFGVSSPIVFVKILIITSGKTRKKTTKFMKKNMKFLSKKYLLGDFQKNKTKLLEIKLKEEGLKLPSKNEFQLILRLKGLFQNKQNIV